MTTVSSWCRRLRLMAILLAVTAQAAEEPAAAGPAKATDDDLRIRGVFNSVLPRTEKKNSLRLIVHPHLGDRFDFKRLLGRKKKAAFK